jgi:hypothetical protein
MSLAMRVNGPRVGDKTLCVGNGHAWEMKCCVCACGAHRGLVKVERLVPVTSVAPADDPDDPYT